MASAHLDQVLTKRWKHARYAASEPAPQQQQQQQFSDARMVGIDFTFAHPSAALAASNSRLLSHFLEAAATIAT